VQRAQLLFDQAQKHREEKLASIEKLRGYASQSSARVNVDALNLSYRWTPTAWSPCSVDCGGGTQTRDAVCQSFSGVTVDESYCNEANAEALTLLSQNCNTDMCAPKIEAAKPDPKLVCETPPTPGKIGIDYWATPGADVSDLVTIAVTATRLCPNGLTLESEKSLPAMKKFSVKNSKGVDIHAPMFQLPLSYDASISKLKIYRLVDGQYVYVDSAPPGSTFTLTSFSSQTPTATVTETPDETAHAAELAAATVVELPSPHETAPAEVPEGAATPPEAETAGENAPAAEHENAPVAEQAPAGHETAPAEHETAPTEHETAPAEHGTAPVEHSS
jgi:hypothetical protein